MYQTLYRKYRPTNFDEVIGQEVVIRTLQNAITNNRINHAYLFTGPRGTGKTSIAKIFAKTINCSNLQNLLPCNKCVSCTQINNKQTVDILEIDAASNNGVDEIRELRNKANLVPANGKYKVYIIDEVHMLTTGAFNALLKTLEEPPKHIIFILATTEPYKIPLTILSRCQRFDFKKINSDLMIKHLQNIAKQEKFEIEEGVLEEISRLSDGCLRDALSILDQVSAYSVEKITLDDVHEINGTLPQEQLKAIINSVIKKEYEQLFKIIDEYNDKGKNFVKLTEEIIAFLRNILLYLNIPNYFKNTYQNYYIYDDIKDKISVEQTIKYLQVFNETMENMKKSSNPKLLFEIAIIQILNSEEQDISIKKEAPLKIEKQQENTNISSNDIKDDNKKIEKAFSSENIIEQTIKSEEKNISKTDLEKLDKLKEIRINNTLSNFQRKYLVNAKDKIEEVRNYIIDPEFSKYASIILDGTLKAASDTNMIFIYPINRLSQEYNKNIIEIDKLLSKIFEKKIHSIATDKNSWEIIKKEFNNKEKKYEYQEEPKNLEEFLNFVKVDNTIIDTTFGELVEYS